MHILTQKVTACTWDNGDLSTITKVGGEPPSNPPTFTRRSQHTCTIVMYSSGHRKVPVPFPCRFRSTVRGQCRLSLRYASCNPINSLRTFADSAFFRHAMECSCSTRADTRCSNGDDTRTYYLLISPSQLATFNLSHSAGSVLWKSHAVVDTPTFLRSFCGSRQAMDMEQRQANSSNLLLSSYYKLFVVAYKRQNMCCGELPHA